MDAGHHRHPEIHRAAKNSQLEATVLGNPPLRDVQFRHDLDAGDRLLGHFLAFHHFHFQQHPIDPILDREIRRSRFKMDVAGAELEGIINRRMHQLDYGAGSFADRFDRQILDGLGRPASLRAEREHIVHRAGIGLVLREHREQRGAMDQNPQGRLPELLIHPGLPGRIERIAKGHTEKTVPVSERQAFVRHRFGVGDTVEICLAGIQGIVAQAAVLEGRGQFRRELVVAQLHLIVQRLDQSPFLTRGAGFRERQLAR